MKQIFLCAKDGSLQISDIPTPALKPGGVLVKTGFSLISAGTEKSVIELGEKNLLAKAQARPDLVNQVLSKIKTDGLLTTLNSVRQKLDDFIALGYSSAGEVIAVGENASEFKIGDRVACAGGNFASHAEIVYIPKNLCVKISDNVSCEEAAFAAVAAIALAGIRNLNLTHGEKVGVIGLGLIGQLAVQILKAYGHPVIGFDINEKQIERAKCFGLDQGVSISSDDSIKKCQTFTENMGLDAVLVTAASKSNEPIALSGELSRKRGRVSIVGDVTINIPRKIFYEKELQATVSCSYGPGRYDKSYEEKGMDYPFAYVRWTEQRNIQEIIRLMADNKISTKQLTTHIFNFDRAVAAYDLITHNPKHEEIVGVLLQYSQKAEIQSKIVYNESATEYKKNEQVNIGVIGIGNFSKTIVLPLLKKIGSAKLIAVADNNGKRAEGAIKKYGGQYATTNYKQIIDDPQIDMVIITTRHGMHAKLVIEALRNNKNVHVEKPLCLNQDELKDIMAAAKSSTGRLLVGFNRRFAPHIVKAKEYFKNISPLIISCRMNSGFIPKEHWVHDLKEGGGRIIGEACHFVDLCQHLAGCKPKKIYASMSPWQTADNAVINIDFTNGSKGSIIYTSLGPKSMPKEYVEIFGGEQSMVIDNFKSGAMYGVRGKKKINRFSQNKGHFNEFKLLIEAIQQGKSSPIPLAEIIASTQTTLDVLKSINENRVIEIEKIWE